MAEGPGPPTASAAALQSTANWQYAVLSRKSADVTMALAANRLAGILAGHLKAQGIIGQPVFEQATNYAVGVTEYARVEHLVTAVLTKTKCNPQCYHDFIKVLELDGIRPDTEAARSCLLPTAAMPPTASATTGSSGRGGTLVKKEALPKLLNLLSPIVHNWDLFAQQIGVPPTQISQIMVKNPQTGLKYRYKCFTQALEFWQSNHDNPVYESIVDILDPGIGKVTPVTNRVLASEVKEFMVKEQVTGPTTEDDYTKENIMIIKSKFANLLQTVRKYLQKKMNKDERNDLRQFILDLNLCPDISIPKSSDLNVIFEAIRCNGLWDHMNYFLLERIVKQFCGDNPKMTDETQKFKMDRAGFLLATKIKDYIPAAKACKHEQPNPVNPDHFEELSIKLNECVADYSLKYLEELWQSLSFHMQLPPITLLLEVVDRGCIQIVFLIPTKLVPEVIHQAKYSAYFYGVHHIHSVTVGENCVYDRSVTMAMLQSSFEETEESERLASLRIAVQQAEEDLKASQAVQEDIRRRQVQLVEELREEHAQKLSTAQLVSETLTEELRELHASLISPPEEDSYRQQRDHLTMVKEIEAEVESLKAKLHHAQVTTVELEKTLVDKMQEHDQQKQQPAKQMDDLKKHYHKLPNDQDKQKQGIPEEEPMLVQTQGGYNCDFVEKTPEGVQTECSVCRQILRQPHIVGCCGNRFCQSCINRIKVDRKSCPLCNATAFELMHDKQSERKLKDLKVHCTHAKSGCEWMGELRLLDKHLNINPKSEALLEGCGFIEIKCIHCGYHYQRNLLASHQKEECQKYPTNRGLIMSREKPQELTMPCLGRPFQLGMLYDCRSDQLVSSVALWNQETLEQSLVSKPQKDSNFEVIVDNSIESKLSKLGVDENLKLSFQAGLVNVSGAAAYLNDQTSSENQVRISLRYQTTAWIDQLSIGKLGDLVNPDVFKDTNATHFVSAVLYGNDAIIVFDQEVSHDEIPHSHGFMKSMVEKLPTICTSGNTALDISDTDKRKAQKFQCKVYCDLPLPEISSTFEGVVTLCKDLPTLLGESDSPQKVWLYPLSKLNSKVEPIIWKISAGLVMQTQDFMEATHELKMKTRDLMNSEVCTNFVAIKKQLSCFKRRIAEYKVDFASNLATLIPKVRGGVEEEDQLNKLFTENDASPFSHARLSSWLEGKMSEVKVLKKYLGQMKDFEFAFLPGDMDSVVGDPEYNLVISLTFKTAGQHDPYLKRMTAYLQQHAIGQDVKNPPTPWYSNPKILSNMKVQTSLFKSFAKANEQAKKTKFVVTSSSDELSEEGAVIELYEDCNKEIFELPSQPGKPSATSVTHSSIQVNWSKPKNGAENVQFYTVFYCDLSCSPEQWKAENTSGSKDSITVTALGPQKKYCFKVQAGCKAGLSEVSEVSELIQTDLVSVAPGKPIVSSKSHNSIQLQWSKAQYGEHNADFYTISCHVTKDSPELESKKVKTEGAKQSATVSDLDPQTAYCFKVHAEFRNAVSLVSDISDPIPTYPVPVPPGKPIASNVTHNSVQLEWSKPQYKEEKVDCYTVFYHKIEDPPNQEQTWKEVKMDPIHEQSVTVSSLAPHRRYSFKVCAKFESGMDLDSNNSDHVQTYPVPVPPGKPFASNVTHSSVQLKWSKPQYKEEKVDCYTVLYHEIKDAPNQEQTWKALKMYPIHKESITIVNLAPHRKYFFKVRAKFESGIDLDSNNSDPVQTYPVPVPPGKPIASNVAHNSLQLEWSKPQYKEEKVDCYTVFYHEIEDPPNQKQTWKEVKMDPIHEQSVTVSSLAPHRKYSFKVCAKFESGMDLDSNNSDPVQTYPVPVPPGKPIASNVTHNSVQLKWSKPQYKEEKVDCYTIFYHEIEDPPNQEQTWKEVKMNSIHEQSVTVSSLAPHRKYSFKVCAKFESGMDLDSNNSDPVQTYPVPVPPGKPITSNVTHNSVQLKWSKPQYKEEKVDCYTIFYHEIKDAQNQEQTWKALKMDPIHKESLAIVNLGPHRKYSFKVCAKFECGMDLDSNNSDPVQTYPVPVPPGKPIASNVAHNSLQLEWSKPQYKEEKVDCYTVFYHEIEDPPNQKQTWKEVKMDPIHEQSVTVSSLAPHRKYSFKVCAKFESGMDLDSNNSDPVQTYPVPVPPGKPIASNMTHNSVQLEWSKPQFKEEKVDCYTVFYHEIEDPPNQEETWKEVKMDPIHEQSVTISSLAPHRKYSFKVCAKFESGMDLDSNNSDHVQTYPVPVPPGKPIANNVTHNSVQLEWSKPQYKEEKVDCYSVFYREIKDAQNQEQTWKALKMDPIHKESITIVNLAPHRKYSFKVYAKFERGMDFHSISSDSVQTYTVPVPPGKPIASNVTHNSIQLEWSKPQYKEEKVDCYTVFYHEIEDPPNQEQTWKEVKMDPIHEQSVTVSSLAPHRKYSFKVCAKFESGMDLLSEISDLVQPYPVPVPPCKPIASNVTHNSVQLKWSKPQYKEEKIDCYTVFYHEIKEQPSQEQTWKEVKMDPIHEESVTVSSLAPHRKYSFKVCGIFESGMDLPSEISDLVQTYPVPVPPGKPIVSNVTHNSVDLEWSKPQYRGQSVEFYTVFYCDNHDPLKQWKEVSLNSPKQSVTVDNLASQTVYSFKVRATLKAGMYIFDSDISDLVQTYPLPVKPGKPTASNVTHNSIQLEWSKAQYGAQNVSYAVCYYEFGQIKEIDTPIPSVTVNNLIPQTEYQFKVNAKFRNDMKLFSDISDPITTYPPPMPPGKPVASSRTHNSVQLEWAKPDCEAQTFHYYTVFYRKAKSKKGNWKEAKVGKHIREELAEVCDLAPETEYYFKVHAVFNFGTWNSDISDPIYTRPASVSPGKPFAFSVTHNSIELQWPKPEYGEEYVKFYTVFYHEMRGPWKEKKSKGPITSITIDSLLSKKEYCFKIRAEITPCGLTGSTSETSDSIKTTDRVALRMLSAFPTREGTLEVHKLLMVEQMSDKLNRIRKCVIGKHPPCIPSQQKVLLVVGATGAGKTTLINGMINYILKVEWKDHFRFKLITEEDQQTQAKSQTKWITAYTLPKMEGSPVPYTLTVIDTPGFGDTAGLERDKVITKQIKEFFSTRSPNGIDHIDGIGFVTQSALARLTPTQRYIFNAILAIFGKDVADNIFMMVTFADGQTPPVMAAIKDAALPYNFFYKFNNSALFASNHVEADAGDLEADNFDRMFWEMGTVSFKDFFIDFSNATPTSLQLTREVLDERERLETTISGLHPQIRRGLAKIEEMRQEEEVLKEHEAEIATNKDFTYAVDITKQRKVDLQGQGIHVTNCLRCNLTCHPNCRIPKDEDKHLCSAMDRTSGFCTVCTKKCKWDQHVNNPYRYEEYVVQEQRTLDDLKKKYDEAVAGKTQKESMLIGIDNQLKGVHTEVLTMIKQVQKCLQRLDEIALKPNPLTEVDFLDLLIESEKQQAEPGWLSRVRYYESAKQQAEMLQHLQAEDVAALDTEPENSQYTSWYARFKYWIGWS